MIKFNGVSSDDFGITILKDVSFTSPSRNLESVKVLGRDGELQIGDGTLNNVSKSFPFIVKNTNKDIAQVASDLSNWLKFDSEWHDLEFSGDNDYIYQAIATSEYDLQRVMAWFGKGTLDFELKPYKFLKSGLNEVVLGSSIKNPLNRPSKPKITIKGTGNITLTIGASELTLKNVDGGIVVDSLYQTVTNLAGTALAWDKVTSYPLPTIKADTSNVLRTGNITEIKIIPRWEAIV